MVKKKCTCASTRGERWETLSVPDQNVVVPTYRDAWRMLFRFLKACSLSLTIFFKGSLSLTCNSREMNCRMLFVLSGYVVTSPILLEKEFNWISIPSHPNGWTSLSRIWTFSTSLWYYLFLNLRMGLLSAFLSHATKFRELSFHIAC